MENLKSGVTDAKISPNCLMPKFKKTKIAPIRSFPEGLIQFDTSTLRKTQGEKLVYGEKNDISRGDRAMKVEAVVAFEQKDGEQIAQIETIDELGNTEHIDMMNVVDTLKRKAQVDSGDCLDVLYELKMRERDMIKPKRRKVSSLRDFPKDLKSYDVPVDQKSKEDCVKETNDVSDELLKVDSMSRGDLVDPVVDALSREDEFEKQEAVETVDLEAVLQSDVDLALHGEARKDEETISKFECGEHDNENVSLVETASEDAENVQLLNELCTSVVYPFRFPKRRKVSAVRDFPDALKILKAHNEASEKNLNQRAAHKLAGKNETTCDSHESSAPTEKSLSRNSRTLLTPPKEDTINFDEQEVQIVELILQKLLTLISGLEERK
ncbi:uncharacterized protein LOC132635073 [Lycium barbarum]|uniref:uncharacterized protein LOC132635073 n=1 Tax=Lycium barbarum TaxID=112863 RepID=UPI00293EEB37|nr:uncharacterized protein LOC132635073 [Lycium barbarum]